MKTFLFYCLAPALLAVAFIQTQPYTLKGKVHDDQGNPVASAVVAIKGTNRAMVTDSSGNFQLTNITGREELVISAIGYQTTTELVAGRTQFNVSLIADQQHLQEVLVTGIASRRPMQLSGATAAVSGRVYGLSVSSPPSIRIRSSASIVADKRKPEKTEESKSFNTEGYDVLVENPFLKTTDNPLSTFSIDVDAASYSNIRRIINDGTLPPAGAVRIEEMINYFTYDYDQPSKNEPFNVNLEAGPCPWNQQHQLVMVGLQGRKIPNDKLPPANLVFLIDVSGSMDSEDKLPLVQSSMKLLADQLRPQDNVAIVVYAGQAGLVLPSTSGASKIKIKSAIDELEAGGSTAGGQGIQLAYNTARASFIKGGNNRVILCTDGDFNVGVSSDDALVKLIENERKSGVFLTVLGFGTGNYQDAKMQKLADKGNGNHAYIDNLGEARKVLVKEAGGTLYTIAKDVKLQVEFNPAKVQGYRLIGYENRILAKEDFNDDTKDAGELGSGHTVTAFYEIIPVGVKSAFLRGTDSLRYQVPAEPFSESEFTEELMYVKLRFKKPDEDQSKLVSFPVATTIRSLQRSSENFRFAAAVAQFGMLLLDSKFKGNADFDQVYDLAKSARGTDKEGYRLEFLELVKAAAEIKGVQHK